MIQKRSFKNYVLVSVAFHVVFFLSLLLITKIKLSEKLPDTAIEVSLLSNAEIAQLQKTDDDL